MCYHHICILFSFIYKYLLLLLFSGKQDPVYRGRRISEETSPLDGAREQIAATKFGENDPKTAATGLGHR